MRLSQHFTLGELCKTSAKTPDGNIPSRVHIENLKRLCGWLEMLRSRWNMMYGTGDEPVIINSGRGLQAVLIAYVLPALVMLVAFSVLYILKLPELWIALITILVVCIYGWVLYLMRHRLQRKFTFRIEKQ